jgi:glutamine synthetase type III
MKETLIHLDNTVANLKNKLNKSEDILSDEKWYYLFDTIIKELIDIRVVADFVNKTQITDKNWDIIQKVIKQKG